MTDKQKLIERITRIYSNEFDKRIPSESMPDLEKRAFDAIAQAWLEDVAGARAEGFDLALTAWERERTMETPKVLREKISKIIDEELGTGNTPTWMLDQLQKVINKGRIVVGTHKRADGSVGNRYDLDNANRSEGRQNQ